jgi:hypothetical protein
MALTPTGVGPTVLLEVQSKAALTQKYNKVHSGIQSMMTTYSEMMSKVQMDLVMAEASGDKMMIAIAKEALQSMKSMTTSVVEEEDGLKKQLDAKEAANPTVLLQTQKSEMDLEQDMPVIKNSIQDAVTYLQSGLEKESGEAVLNAARRLMMPVTSVAEYRKDPLYTNPQNSMLQVTKIDEVARKVVLGLSEADTVSSLAQGAAMEALENSATELYKDALSGKSEATIESQTTDIVKQLAKFLPKKKTEEKKVLLKAKDSKPAVHEGEEANKEAMKALEGAMSTQSQPSLVQTQASAQDAAKMDKAMSALDQEIEKTEKADELNSLEADLAELAGQDKANFPDTEDW